MSDTCEKCGDSIEIGELFCSNCGSRNEKHEEPAVSDESQATIDLSIKWNESASQFLAGIGSNLEFNVSPVGSADISDICFYFRFPDSDSIEEKHLQFARLSNAQIIHVNYRPAETAIGTRRIIDMYVSYVIDGKTRWFFEQLPIDIFSADQGGRTLIDNFSIRIDSIVQEGKAGDPKLSILDSFKPEQKTSINEVMKGIRSSSAVWRTLSLVESKPLMNSAQRSETGFVQNSDSTKPNGKVGGEENNSTTVSNSIVIEQKTKESNFLPYLLVAVALVAVGGVVFYLLLSKSPHKTTVTSNEQNRPTIQITEKKEKTVSIDLDSLSKDLSKLDVSVGSENHSNSSFPSITIEAKKPVIITSKKTYIDPKRDSDRDGLTDLVEKKYGLDPANPLDALHDSDNDGFTNRSEVLGIYNGRRTERATDMFDPESHHDFALRLAFVNRLEPRHLFTIIAVKADRALIEYQKNGAWERSVVGQGGSFSAAGNLYTLEKIESETKSSFEPSFWKNIDATTHSAIINGGGTRGMYKNNDQKIEGSEATAVLKDRQSGIEYTAVKGQSLVLGSKKTGITTYSVVDVSDTNVALRNSDSKRLFFIVVDKHSLNKNRKSKSF